MQNGLGSFSTSKGFNYWPLLTVLQHESLKRNKELNISIPVSKNLLLTKLRFKEALKPLPT